MRVLVVFMLSCFGVGATYFVDCCWGTSTWGDCSSGGERRIIYVEVTSALGSEVGRPGVRSVKVSTAAGRMTTELLLLWTKGSDVFSSRDVVPVPKASGSFSG